MSSPDLTPKERLILANQFEILGLLQEDEEYTRLAQNLRVGHKWIYQQSHALHVEDDLDESATQQVLSILELYRLLQVSYEELTDKSGIDERDVQFPGFDGNNETKLLSFAQALTEFDRFTDVLGDTASNSHAPTTEMYQRMIEEWLRLGQPTHPLSREAIQAILAAKVHPSMR